MNPRLTTRDSATKNSSTSTGPWNEPRFQLQSVKLEKARRSLRAFMGQAWPVLEPGTEFVEGIHIDAICAHLQAVTEGRIQNLIINVPPGHAKSLLTGVFWPAWVWIEHPDRKSTRLNSSHLVISYAV